jgi:flagellar basal-body rod protein FlgG
MTQGTYTLAANMVNQINRVDTISNNLANVNTTGFKADNLTEGTFNNYLAKMEKENKEPLPLSSVMNTIPKIDGRFIDSELGSITPTGNKLDFALSKRDTFFKVQDDKGNIFLTRDGSFKSLNGELVTQNGLKVLNNNNEPLAIDEENEFINNMAVVSTNYNNLEKVGDNNYKVTDNEKLQAVENATQYIVKEAIERSNVNGVKAMVSLIDANRRFEQAQKAITGIDEINKKVIDSVGNNQ